jgi:hypothetical protein
MACADAVLAAEQTARAGRRGLRDNPNFAPLPAENRTHPKGERGHFTLVEGKTLSACERSGTLFI